MATAKRRDLLVWNRDTSRYQLTSLGRQLLGARNLPRRTAPTAPARGARLGVASPFSLGAVLASAACVGLGVAAMSLTLHWFEPQQPAAALKTASRHDGTPRVAAATNADQTRPLPAPSAKPAAEASTAPGRAESSLQPGTPPEANRAATSDAVSAPKPPEHSAKAATPTASTPRKPPEEVLRVPNPESRSLAGPAESAGPPALRAQRDVRSAAQRRHPAKAQESAQQSAHAEARSRGAPADSGHGKAWASGKIVNVTRAGLLVREERALADGTVVVRYQYGNGPARFEKRSRSGGAHALGFANAGEPLTRLGGFGWLR